jgi:hypothetical protein
MDASANETLLGNIAAEEDDQIIEVVLINELKERCEIRLLSFGEGIGWYVQKTMPINYVQITPLIEILGKARTPSHKKPIRRDDISISGKVIRLF